MKSPTNNNIIRCYLQDIIVCLILICDGSWYDRLSLIYDMFKCRGTEEVSYEDILMIIQISSVSMYKLWNNENDWKQSDMNRLGEALADEAYAKVSYMCSLLHNVVT